jgi:hypothetical protein
MFTTPLPDSNTPQVCIVLQAGSFSEASFGPTLFMTATGK